MKKIVSALVFALGILSVVSAISFWEGSAVMSQYGDFPLTGYYAACNTFPRNTQVEVKNLENGKVVKVIITAALPNSGIFISLSPEAAMQIGITQGQLFRVRASIPQDLSMPPENTISSFESADPDVNPALLANAALESKPVVTETKPAVTETKPAVTETKTAVAETKPAVTETKAAVTETKPTVAETKPAVTETKAAVAETKPTVTETKPTVTETKAVVAETKPAVDVKPEPSKALVKSSTKTEPNTVLEPPASISIKTEKPEVYDSVKDRPQTQQVVSLIANEPERMQEEVKIVETKVETKEVLHPDVLSNVVFPKRINARAFETAQDRPLDSVKNAYKVPYIGRVELVLAEPVLEDKIEIKEEAIVLDYAKPNKKGTAVAVDLQEPSMKPDELPEASAMALAHPMARPIPPLAEGQFDLKEEKPEAYALETKPSSTYYADGILSDPEADSQIEKPLADDSSVINPPDGSLVDADLSEPSESSDTSVTEALTLEQGEPSVSEVAGISANDPEGELNALSSSTEKPETTVVGSVILSDPNLKTETTVSVEVSSEKPPVVVVKPVETKPLETKPLETKPLETTSVAKTESTETKPIVKTETTSAQAKSVVIDPKLAPLAIKIDRFESDRYYVQIGAFSSAEAANKAIKGLDPRHPAMYEAVVQNGKSVFRIYVGPLKRDESGAVLLRLKSIGFKDAYVKKG